MSNLRTEHEIEIDNIHDWQLAAKDAEIERLKAIITELAEWCESDPESITDHGKAILQRAYEATR